MKQKQCLCLLVVRKLNNKVYQRQTLAAQSATQNGSGSNEVTSSQSKCFSEDPLDWNDKQKDFEADLAAEHQHVLEYIRGTYHFADCFTVSREVGVLGDLNHRPALKHTQAEYDQMPSANRLRFIDKADKLEQHDTMVKNKAWSKIWNWTSQSHLLCDLVHPSEATRDAHQAYVAIKSHFELTTVQEKSALLETQLNKAHTLAKHLKSPDSKSVKRLQTHISQISNKLANLQPPLDVPD